MEITATFELTYCRVCGSENDVSNSLEQLVSLEHPLETERGVGVGSDILLIQDGICPVCGLIQRLPMPTDEALEDFYSQQSSVLGTFRLFEASESEKALRHNQADFVERYGGVREESKVLDVGCFNGSLLLELRSRRLDAIGIERSIPIERLPEEIRDFVQPLFLKEKSRATDRFELVTISHVLEHVTSPVDFLSSAFSLLSTNGNIFVEVPNVHGMDTSDFAGFTSLEHTYNFSLRTLESVSNQAGLSVIHAEIFSNEPVVGSVIRAILSPTISEHFSTETNTGDVGSEIEFARGFVRDHRSQMSALMGRIKNFLGKGDEGPVFLYGAGVGGFHLLKLLREIGAPDPLVIDGNPEKKGKLLIDLPVYSPDTISGESTGTVLVSSRAYRDEIRQIVRSINPDLQLWSPWD